MVSHVAPRPKLLAAAVVGIVLSGLLSFVMLTPAGWGMSWQDIATSWGAKAFFFVPLIALIVAGMLKFSRRPSPLQEIVLLAAPFYQTIFFAFSYFTVKPGA